MKQFIYNETPYSLYFFTKNSSFSSQYSRLSGTKIYNFNDQEFSAESKKVYILNPEVEV